jgi:hypothetical protein
MNKRFGEVDTYRSKAILLEASLEAKDRHIASFKEELSAREKLFEVLVQTERAHSNIQLE